jgi:hypothetical protein
VEKIKTTTSLSTDQEGKECDQYSHSKEGSEIIPALNKNG